MSAAWQVNEAYHTLSDVQKRAAYDTLVLLPMTFYAQPFMLNSSSPLFWPQSTHDHSFVVNQLMTLAAYLVHSCSDLQHAT